MVDFLTLRRFGRINTQRKIHSDILEIIITMEDKELDLDELFRKAEGKPIEVNGKSLVRIDRFTLPRKKISLKFNFLEINSEWKQGFILKTRGSFKVNQNSIIKNAIVLWEDTAPNEFVLNVDSKDGVLLVYNVWDFGDGVTQAWHNGAAINIERSFSKKVYHCNDGHLGLDLYNLVFSMSWEQNDL